MTDEVAIPLGQRTTLHCSPLNWAAQLKRVFDIDIFVCPRSGGTLRVIAAVSEAIYLSGRA